MSSELTERPLEQASEDLLGMKPHAEKLAGLIMRSALPLTVGIYGPWGAGKTSFANLLVNELRQQPGWDQLNRISFSAWPYVTPTAIWQALVEQIARTVYGQERAPDQPTAAPPPTVSPDWKRKLRNVLLSDAMTLRPEPANPQRDSYERLVRRLSSSGAIADRTPSQQLGGLTLGAFAKLVLAAAATMSAPLGPISQLFSGNGASTPTPQELSSLESIEQIRKDLRSVFTAAGQTRNVVLIDDLDRCHPEIALDVLETIKIFFAESVDTGSSWLFLVPADERLVGHGLRARLGTQLEHVDDIDTRSYLEKIIQGGVGLPEVKADSAHSLIADYIPEWAGASDLLISAFDGNPRRIKQQGVLLSYRYPDRDLRDGLSRRDANALAKLVQLGTRHKDLLAEANSLNAQDLGPGPVGLDTLRVLVSVADLRPGPGGAPQTRDPVFSYVATLTTDQDGSTTPQLLAVTYLRRMLELRDAMPAIFDLVAACSAADESRYVPLMSAFDSWLDARLADESVEAAADIRKLAEAVDSQLDNEEIRITLIKEPRLSAIPTAYVRLVAADKAPLPADADVAGVTGDRFGAGALRIADMHPEAVESLASALRLGVAKDVVDRRRYAKVQLLLTRWPELIRLARGQGGARRLRDLEAAMLRGEQYVSIPQSWKHLTVDENLREFLQLPPSLAQCYGEDVSSIADNSAVAPLLLEPLPTPPTPTSPFAQAPSTPLAFIGGTYTNLELMARTVGNVTNGPSSEEQPQGFAAIAGGTASAMSEERRVAGEITLSLEDQNGLQERAHIRVPVDDIMRLTEQLSDPRLMGSATSRVPSDSLSVRDILTDIGTQLWSSTIGASADVEALLMRTFDAATRLRLAVVSDADILAALPWECLFFPRHGIFAAQTLKLSIVRKIAEPAPLSFPRQSSPLRVLIAEASPKGLAILGADQEIALIDKSLEQAKSAGLAHIEVIRDATADKLWRAIQSFKPHVFHFVGHAGFHGGQGVIILVDESRRPDFVPADALGLLMQERGVLLAVLNGCETGWPNLTDMTRGVSQTLVRRGLPAVIGTTRNVENNTALRFADEFYKGMGDGLSVEPALVEARKVLGLKGWDWSMYAMYANTNFPLHTIRIQIP